MLEAMLDGRLPRGAGPTPHGQEVRRSRGQRAGLGVEQIVEAASKLAPDRLTMQALAQSLGVDPKAINHHVRDRSTLLAMVARKSFRDEFAQVVIDGTTGWRDACRTYAAAVTRAAAATSPYVAHLDLSREPVTRYLEAAEAVMDSLLRAGFDRATSVRALVLLTNICIGYARDTHPGIGDVSRRRGEILELGLRDQDPARFPHLTQVSGAGPDTYDHRQLDFSVEVFLDGLARRRGDPAAGGPVPAWAGTGPVGPTA